MFDLVLLPLQLLLPFLIYHLQLYKPVHQILFAQIMDQAVDQVQSQAYLHGMSKAAQQKLRYALYGQVGNVFNEKVFTKTGVQPSEMVKLHLWG